MPTHEPTPATGLLALRPGDAAATDPSDYAVVIMNAWESGRIAAIKARSPHTRVLEYKDMSSTRSYAVHDGVDDAQRPTGVGYRDAERNHPDWFLLDTLGRRIEWKGYSGHWWLDPGNADYATAWTDAVVADLTAGKWDGVFIDNALYTPDFYLPPGRRLAKYKDDASFGAATESLLAVASNRIEAAGFDLVPNLGARFPDHEQYARWVGYGTGAMREHFARFDSDGRGTVLMGDEWAEQLDQQEIVQSQGKAFLAVAYGFVTDEVFARYARASFLLAWDGGPGALLYTPPSAGVDPWRSEWTTTIGQPSAPREAVRGGAWRRRYSEGIVVVNPTAGAIVTVALDGTYAAPDGGPITEITLAPGTGAVLRYP